MLFKIMPSTRVGQSVDRRVIACCGAPSAPGMISCHWPLTLAAQQLEVEVTAHVFINNPPDPHVRMCATYVGLRGSNQLNSHLGPNSDQLEQYIGKQAVGRTRSIISILHHAVLQ